MFRGMTQTSVYPREVVKRARPACGRSDPRQPSVRLAEPSRADEY
jgi:hypothetical protein